MKSDFDNRGTYFPPYANINDTSFGTPTNDTRSYNNVAGATVAPIVLNQTRLDEVEVNNLKMSLKSNAQYVACPYCKHQSLTRADQTCSVGSVLCCVAFGGLMWLLFQGIRKKDINCYDAKHYCIRCGNNLANYKAC